MKNEFDEVLMIGGLKSAYSGLNEISLADMSSEDIDRLGSALGNIKFALRVLGHPVDDKGPDVVKPCPIVPDCGENINNGCHQIGWCDKGEL